MSIELKSFLKECKKLNFEKIYHKEYYINANDKIKEENLIKYEKKYKIISKKKIKFGWEIHYIKKEQEFIFFNYEYSAILHIDTFDQTRINNSELFLNIKYNGKERMSGLDVCPLNYTNIKGIRAKCFNSLRPVLLNVLSHGEPLKYWYKDMGSSLRSYLSHKNRVSKGNEWENLTQEKINHFPQEVKERLYGNLIDSNKVKMEKKEDYKKYKDFYKKLDYEDKMNSFLRNVILDRFSYEDFIHKDILKKAKEENLKEELLSVTCIFYKNEVFSEIKENYEDVENEHILKTMSKFSDQELKLIQSKKYYFKEQFFNKIINMTREELLRRKISSF